MYNQAMCESESVKVKASQSSIIKDDCLLVSAFVRAECDRSSERERSSFVRQLFVGFRSFLRSFVRLLVSFLRSFIRSKSLRSLFGGEVWTKQTTTSDRFNNSCSSEVGFSRFYGGGAGGVAALLGDETWTKQRAREG